MRRALESLPDGGPVAGDDPLTHTLPLPMIAPVPDIAPAPVALASDVPAADVPAADTASGPDSEPAASPTRRAARAAELLAVDTVPVRHARPRRAARVAVSVSIAAAATLLLGSSAAVTAILVDPGSIGDLAAPARVSAAESRTVEAPADQRHVVAALPVPNVEQAQATADICALPEVAEAIAAGDDEGVITAAGGAEAFRIALVENEAACVSLSDPARMWVVINKQRPYQPLGFWPSSLVRPDDVRNPEGATLRADAASAFTRMVAAARAAGVGEIGIESGFRSHATQVTSYGAQVAARGVAGADLVSARPGYSEHQSGLTADVVPCDAGCGSIDHLAGSPQGAWLAEHAWEFGYIVRYEECCTATTGYLPEAWHLRYIGHDLAAAYRAGGWHTLEEFFGLPPAPGYPG